jgi:hypothetical protein
VDPSGAVAIGDMFLISHLDDDRIDIVPLPASLRVEVRPGGVCGVPAAGVSA